MAGSLPAVVVVVIVIVVVVVVVVVIVVIADAVVIVDAVVVVFVVVVVDVISTSRSKVATIQFSLQKSKADAKTPTNKKTAQKNFRLPTRF